MSRYALLIIVAALGALSAAFISSHSPSHRSLLAAAVLAGLGQQSTSSPSMSTSASSTNFVDAIGRLQDQEQSLGDEVAILNSELQAAQLSSVFNRPLKRGNTGSDVQELQTLLNTVSGTTTSSTTGFYGYATEQGVRGFQTQAGLKATGIFDPLTREKLIAYMQAQAAAGNALGDFTPIDLSSIADPEQSVRDLQAQVSQLSSDLSDAQSALQDLQQQVSGLSSEVSDLRASSQANSSSSPGPSSTALSSPTLALSNIKVSNISKTSATITWTSSDPSSSEVDYSKSSALPIKETQSSKNAVLTTAHGVGLSSLSPGALYYYRVVSTDSAGTARSNILTFSTTP